MRPLLSPLTDGVPPSLIKTGSLLNSPPGQEGWPRLADGVICSTVLNSFLSCPPRHPKRMPSLLSRRGVFLSLIFSYLGAS